MVSYNRSLFLVGSALALITAAPLYAQATNTAVAEDGEKGDPGQEIVVTGTRAAGRTKLDTASPVDVLSGATLRQQGTTELGAALSAVVPSIDFPRAAALDGTDAIRPATLRGLSPDQALVLVNGVRGHSSALLNINSGVGRGSAAVDLNTIPTVALDTIEVLRDGASAQYGSDAIAGVVNLRLRQARSGGGANVTYGFYDTNFSGPRAEHSTTGEHTLNAQAWQGFGFGSDGYLTISGEYQRRLPTSRGDVDPRLTPAIVNSRYGDPDVKQYTGWANFGSSISDAVKFYGWVGYQYRNTSSAAFPRSPVFTTNYASVISLYPNGFLPLINTHSKDLNSAVGVKADLGGWQLDANVSYGRNRIDFSTLQSANLTLGAASPKDFYDGALIYDQLIGGIDVTRRFDVFKSLNVAFGVEGRREGYQITSGDAASYAGTGAQGFTGFAPVNEVDKHRENGSIYADIEAQITDALLIGVAGRGEHYSDFGTTGTGKVSARYDFSPHFALRGTFSTGFRAPSLQQQYFTSIASVISGSTILLTGTFPSVAPVSQALGGKALEPEKSTNISVGTVIRLGGLDLTVDAYRIHIRNQLAFSENIAATASPQVAALLAPFNVPQARFFINGVGSTAKGIDAVLHYRLKNAAAGTFDFTVAGNVNDLSITRVPTSTSTLNPAPVLFSRTRIATLESGTPGEKVTGSIEWSRGPLGATARVTYYGDVLSAGTTAATDLYTGKHAITDLELRYTLPRGLQLAIGGSNLFDVYPRGATAANNTTGAVAFPFVSPFGFNGRYLYVRAGFNW